MVDPKYPAFPSGEDADTCGISIRTFLTAMAIVSLADPQITEAQPDAKKIAQRAVALADAVIAELSK